MEDSLLHIFGGAKKRDLTNFNRVEKEEKRKYETAMKYPQSWRFSGRDPGGDLGGRCWRKRRRTRQSFRPVFQRTGFALFERVGSERAASASYAHGRRRADAQNAFHFEGGGGREGARERRRVGRCEWSKKASAEYNNYFTSDLRGPGNWNFRATPGTKAAGSGAPPARGTEHFQLWHYNLLPVPRRMRAAATGTDYINLISSSLTVSTDSPPLPPSSVTIHPTPFRLFLARPGLGQSYVKRARLSAHHCLCKYQCEICAST